MHARNGCDSDVITADYIVCTHIALSFLFANTLCTSSRTNNNVSETGGWVVDWLVGCVKGGQFPESRSCDT